MLCTLTAPDVCYGCNEKVAIGDDVAEDAAGEIRCIINGCGVPYLTDQEYNEIMMDGRR